ncbi:hypothetical protein QYE76_052482 [Lolium multiflorum]|uniref:Disease resistance protein At4g27190-like leucine-rich repeats domain-containing protein n=1 Tax=Lolium multiflorum TaxID=4521 RepID=A0AAD8SVP3_LOLMU|nr:hypothetical protein QYE76_052482 [Lolium multiflorum]
MSGPRKETIRGCYNVQNAGEHIYGRIKSNSHGKVIYIGGWAEFGASAALRYVAALLRTRRTVPELCFDRIIFLDCSKWKNRRAMQREIIRELKLDHAVMTILDKQDEEDDFKGIDESSRNEMDSVSQVIDQTLGATKFVMCFLNGSDNEIDVGLFGIPRFATYGNNIMLWTFTRSSLTTHQHNKKAGELRYTHVHWDFYIIPPFGSSDLCGLLHDHAATIVDHGLGMQDINPTMVAECFLYGLFLCYNFHVATKLDWLSHASNYWICDAIIKGDRARDISNTVHGEIIWECDASLIDWVLEKDMQYIKPPILVVKDDDVYKEGPYRWISVTTRNMEISGFKTIPATTSSLFLAFERFNHSSILSNGLFENSSNLGVLVLCSCAFNFASPPFLRCQSLRFLGLDHCTTSKIGEEENHNHTEWPCLYNLLVLDLRYTGWDEILSEEKISLMKNITELNIEGVRCWKYTTQLKGRLPNLQRLRIIRPTCPCVTSNDVDDSFIDKTCMEILDLSGNSYMKTLPAGLSKASSLRMLVLDGCDDIENIVALGRLPPSLRCFSFDGYGPASQRTLTTELPPEHFRPSTVEDEKDVSTSKISLEGCTKLDNLFVRGLNNLVELDLSGTAIKILDFKTMVVQVPRLKKLYLIGCTHLRAIIHLHLTSLELICIDTRAGIMRPRPSIDTDKCCRLQLHAVIVDARIAYSFKKLLLPSHLAVEDIYFNIHITSSPRVFDGVVQFEETNNQKFDHYDQGSLQQLIPAGKYNDVLSMVEDPLMQAFPQPPASELDRHMEIAEGSCYVESGLERELGLLMDIAESLHLHDVSIHATIRDALCMWRYLRWCRVERCPKLDTVFPSRCYGFCALQTLWASDLLMARRIWSQGSPYSSFKNLQHLHLQSCPRLQFMIPVCESSFPCLETLYMIHCGDLVHVFEPNRWYPEDIISSIDLPKEMISLYPKEIISAGVLFPKLTTIHLHDLPKLQQICKVKMVAPALESIRIRGCWSLRGLPSVAACAKGEKKPTIEIEKDVWDALEWDAGHCPDHFEAPVHSHYYKKKLPRVSFLR